MSEARSFVSGLLQVDQLLNLLVLMTWHHFGAQCTEGRSRENNIELKNNKSRERGTGAALSPAEKTLLLPRTQDQRARSRDGKILFARHYAYLSMRGSVLSSRQKSEKWVGKSLLIFMYFHFKIDYIFFFNWLARKTKRWSSMLPVGY